jgi:hypothetical protein
MDDPCVIWSRHWVRLTRVQYTSLSRLNVCSECLFTLSEAIDFETKWRNTKTSHFRRIFFFGKSLHKEFWRHSQPPGTLIGKCGVSHTTRIFRTFLSRSLLIGEQLADMWVSIVAIETVSSNCRCHWELLNRSVRRRLIDHCRLDISTHSISSSVNCASRLRQFEQNLWSRSASYISRT